MKQSLLLIFLSFFICTYTNAQLASKSATTKVALSKSKISLFPNPAIDFIELNDRNEEVKQIVIYNIVGTKMKDFPVNKDEKYYIADLERGMYLVQMLGRNNQVLTTQRLSKR